MGPALALAFAGAPASAAEALRFERDGSLVREIPFAELRRECGETRVSVPHDPYYARPKVFLACPLARVFELGFGASPAALGDANVFFRALDGYVKPASATLLAEPGAYLAFADADHVVAPQSNPAPAVSSHTDPDPAVASQSNPEQVVASQSNWEPIDRRQVDPGPSYLVWTGAGQADPHLYPWPYQLAAIEVAPFETRYPHTTPTGEPAASPAWRGFAIFRRECVACHAVNGEGGSVGPELNVPRSIVEYRPEEQLKAFVRDPQSFRYTSMPSNPHLSDADLDAIVAYFRAMSARKVDPRAK
jgi:mono/diheme cytochrome c family protein